MADDLAQTSDPFEAELKALLEAIAEPPAQTRAIERAGAAPKVGAGQYGLPYMPPLPRNRLGGAEPEMRSTLSPHADTFMGMTGLPTAMGPAVDMAIKLGRATGDTLAGGPMWAAETGSQLGEAAARDGVIPSFAKIATANAEPDKLQQLLETQAVLQRQAEEAKARRESFRPKGRAPSAQSDPQYTAADQEFRQLNDRLNAHGEMVKQEQNLRSPEHQLAMKKANEAAEEEKRAREANTPWREKNPALANALPNYALAASAAIPGAIGVVRNARSFFPGSPQGMMRAAIAENALARSGGDAAKAALTEAELTNLLARMPGWKTHGLEAGAAALSGGALAAEASMFPDQWDAFNLPDGPKKDKARAEALNPVNYLERGIMGTLTGLSGYEIGSQLSPRRGANAAKAEAIKDNPYSPPPSPAPQSAPSQPQLPPGIKPDKNGVLYDKSTGWKVPKRYFESKDD